MIREFLGLDSRASIENPSVSLNDPATWDAVFGEGMTSAAGVKVSHRGSLKLAPVWQAVSMISGDIAKLPLDIYKRTDEKNREKDKNHPAFRIVRRKANRELSAFKFWRRLMVHSLLWNRGYAYINRNLRGDVVELINLLPDRTAPERVGGELYYVTETAKPDGSPWARAIPAKDILHIEGPNIDETEPCDLVESAKDSWGLALAAQKFASKFFKHGVRSGGVLELPVGISAKARDNVTEGFQKYHAGEENWFRTVILRDGAKFHQNSIAPNEGQVIETREEQVREVARWFNLQPSRLGLSDSVSYNSKSEDNGVYLDSTLSPWLCCVVSECDTKLLSDQQQKNDSHYFEHNTDALLRMDALKRFQIYAIGKRNRILTTNEIRARENMNPVEGGDEFDDFPSSGGIGGNGGDGGSDNQPADGGDNTKNNPDADTEPQDNERSLAKRRVVFRMADHARQKASKPEAFLQWVDGGLRSHRDFANLTIGDDEIVSDFRTRLLDVAESVPESELSAAVEVVAEEFERSA